MNVERRYSKRYPLNVDVYIRYRKQRAFPAKAVDCSLFGMYLETISLTLLTGSLVELELFLGGRNWQIIGVISHAKKNGLGVMFCEPQPEFYQAVISNPSAGLENQDLGCTTFPRESISGEPAQ